MNFRILVVFAVLVSVPAIWSQTTPDTEEGVNPAGVYSESGIDAVSMTSGNLLLHIPVISYPQRGKQLALSFHLYYSNKGWTRVKDNNTYIWQNYGLSGVTFAQDQFQSTTAQIYQNPALGDSGPGAMLMHLNSVVSPDGSSHQVAASGTSLNNIGPGWTVDGTGMYYTPSTNTVIDKGGVRSIATSNAYILEDTEGNEIQLGASGSSGWTDTIGRTLPATWITNPSSFTVPPTGKFTAHQPPTVLRPGTQTSNLTSCPSATTAAYSWSIPGINGGTMVYKFCYQQISYESNFGQSGTLEGGGSTQVLLAMVLPNGTSWTFTYDSWGEVAAVGMPNGGSISYQWVHANDGTSRAVSQSTFNANDGSPTQTWNYVWNPLGANNTYLNVETAPADPNGVRNDTTHLIDYQNFDIEDKYYSGSYTSGTLLKTIDTTYEEDDNPFEDYGAAGRINGLVLTKQTTWPTSPALISHVATTYDSGFTSTIEAEGQQAELLCNTPSAGRGSLCRRRIRPTQSIMQGTCCMHRLASLPPPCTAQSRAVLPV